MKYDRKAQQKLYDMYSTLFLSICNRYAKDKAEAEDMLQEAFFKIFTNIKKFEGKGSFEGWMKRIVINTAITMYNQHVKSYYHSDIEEIADVLEDDELIETDIEPTYNILLEIINELPHKYKVVFNLYAVEDYKLTEISTLLEIDYNTCKSIFRRAKQMILERVELLKKTPLKILA